MGFPCTSIFPCRSRSGRAHMTVRARTHIPGCTEKHLWAPVICFLSPLLTWAPCCMCKAVPLTQQPSTARSTRACPLITVTRQPQENPNLVPNCCAKWCGATGGCGVRLNAGLAAWSQQLPHELSGHCFPPLRCCFHQTRVGEAGPWWALHFRVLWQFLSVSHSLVLLLHVSL